MVQTIGNIHSLESCGTVDGPGIRFVVFVQGCPMRCLYCHNPDTWDFNVNKKMSVDEILTKYENVKEFLKNGGLTVTGGEPLAQIDFVIDSTNQADETMRNRLRHHVVPLLKKENPALIRNALFFSQKMDELIDYVDENCKKCRYSWKSNNRI